VKREIKNKEVTIIKKKIMRKKRHIKNRKEDKRGKNKRRYKKYYQVNTP
jgi:hypothetical protein